ncbi:fibronectin type III domain-containing protein [Compostimonas suwonensis]|uniref:PT repeat-containing protein n=1 Tax=Compostimonas suwonensis TaxID=1048394 RepID=A0A2M9BU52_9MICO|nr:PT domain-containing protein [Compostimonas suwonensis]PJJ61451.1 PT repeat-containing protein [Compostimonas suwonensis]
MIGDASARAVNTPRRRKTLLAGGIIAALALGTIGSGIAYAAGGGLAPPPVNPATVHLASAVPDRVILTPTITPATTQNVSWRTSVEVTAPQVQLAPMTDGPVQATSTTPAVSTTEFATDLGYSIKYHTATLTGLTPATSYVYRVGDGETWSEWFEFATASTEPEPFSFLVQGDAQNDVKSYASRAFRAAYEARPYAKAVVHLGDLIDTDVADAEWGEWFSAAGFENAYLNVIATPGNHEYYPGPELTRYWKAQFEFPDNGPADTPEAKAMFSENTYFVDYQGVRFISLNGSQINTADLASQTAWLDQVLEENPGKWSVVSFHQPVFSVTSGRDNKTIRDAWLPIFEKHNVDLVLSGHDHAYGRGNLFANEQNLPAGASAETSQTGPVYMVTVAGPKMYVPDDPATNNWVTNGAHMRSMNRDTQMFQTVDVTGDEIHVESRKVTGELFDAFTITKSDDGTKLVTDDTVGRASGPGSTRSTINAPERPTPVIPGATDEPTAEPTDEPTDEPTPEPTDEPTDEPTGEPTTEPTDEPTAEPTDEPTGEPTDEPTGEPTTEPTDEPTSEPTTEPTVEPTEEPTTEPTTEPTSDPTSEPTTEPTAEPTDEPTDPPSHSAQLELSATGIAAGGELFLKGSGFKPNEDMEATLHSDPISLGFTKADASGDVLFSVHIPAGVPAGVHTIVLRGLESGVTAEKTITVLPVGAAPTGVKNLADTGASAVGTALAIGGFTLFAGLLVLFGVRYYRKPRQGGAV